MSLIKILTEDNESAEEFSMDSNNTCPDGKYWVRPYTRKHTDKNGNVSVQSVKGYCSSYHDHFAALAVEEHTPLDHLFYALTVYGEARGESIASKRAIAWVIRNRLKVSKAGSGYRDVVLKKYQFSCWLKSDPNYARLQQPGKHDPFDKRAWEDSKKIMEEVHNAPEEKNPLPGVCHYFSGPPDVKKHPWQKNYFDLPDVPHFHFVKLKG